MAAVQSTDGPSRYPEEDYSGYPWAEKANSILKNIFKLDKFKPHQLSAINEVMSGRNCILIMPTAGGKSLCYQLPALVLPGITLVVSPLVSLMEDQIRAMKTLNVPAVLLNASSSYAHKENVYMQMTEKEPKIKLIYVTPEQLKRNAEFSDRLELLYKTGLFSLIAIDEVHCCSQWGHDFREDYLHLGTLKTEFPNVPILGVTATATKSVITDVKNILNIQGCLEIQTSLNRPNLKYEVLCKSPNQKFNVDKLEDMLKNRFKSQSGIIYCFRKIETDVIAGELQKRGIKVKAYHGDLDAKSRSSIYQSWVSNDIQVVVATIAFGMGIDKPDVRFVIHLTMPKSMETYYQESGRAGRDNQPSTCILFFRVSNFFDISRKVHENETNKKNLYEVLSYCLDLSRCRHAIMVEHFGENLGTSDCNKMCDFCDKSRRCKRETVDVADEYNILLTILKQRKQRNLRIDMLIDELLGKGPLKYRPPDAKPTSLSRTRCEWMVARLLLEGYLLEDIHGTVRVTTYIALPKKPKSLPSSGKLLMTFRVLEPVRKPQSTSGEKRKLRSNPDKKSKKARNQAHQKKNRFAHKKKPSFAHQKEPSVLYWKTPYYF